MLAVLRRLQGWVSPNIVLVGGEHRDAGFAAPWFNPEFVCDYVETFN